MATRSAVGKEDQDGNVVGVYVHWDGYPEGVGAILDEHYRDPAKVAALLELGSVSSLAPEIGERHPFNERREDWTTFYGRDRGEKDVGPKTFPNREEFRAGLSRSGAEFSYLLDDSGDWIVSKGRGPWKPLREVLASDDPSKSLDPTPDGGPPDIVVEREGPLASVVLLRGVTAAGSGWLEDHVDADAPNFAGRIACETRYAVAIVEGARRDGLVVATGDEA